MYDQRKFRPHIRKSVSLQNSESNLFASTNATDSKQAMKQDKEPI